MDKTLISLHAKQNIKKKQKKRRLVEPSNDAISPFPACSSIPGEKRKFKDHLEVKKIKSKLKNKINKTMLEHNWLNTPDFVQEKNV